MASLSVLQIVMTLWAIVTVIYVGLFLYRSMVGAGEEDTLFLSAAESHMAAEQAEIMKRVNKLDPITKKFGFASLAMTIVLGCAWVYSIVQQIL